MRPVNLSCIASAGTGSYAQPMRILYLATAGSSDPTRASIPLHIAANGSIEVEQECAMVLVGDATELASRQTAERVGGWAFHPHRELLEKLVDNRVPIFV